LAHRGEIVSIDTSARYTPELIEAAGDVKRAIYRSTSGVTGQPVNVGGIFAVPKGTPPNGSWPVVSVGDATAAYNLIDATRAAAHLFPDVSSNWAAVLWRRRRRPAKAQSHQGLIAHR
jgi:hypothetical protein